VSDRARQLWGRCGLFAVALVAAWLLKRHYSQASPEELRWVLAPTAALVQLALDADLVFRPGEGYLSRELSILISPACAGVNFLIVAFLSLALGFGRSLPGGKQGAVSLLAFAAVAYLTTLLVNTLRICLSVWLAHLAARLLGLTFQSVHRLLGIAVYLAGLVTLCLTVQLCLRKRLRVPTRHSTLLVAFVCYLTITLLVPLLRGAAQSSEYWGHAAPVSVLVGGALALVFAVKGRTWDDGWHGFRSAEHSHPKPVAHQPAAGG
jgi:exosortase K